MNILYNIIVKQHTLYNESLCLNILYFWSCLGGSCICGLSPGFVDDQDLLERLSGAFASPRLRSVRLSRRLSVCHTRAQIPKSASAASKNVDNVDEKSKMWTKSAQNRLGHAAVAQWFDWLPDVLALFMGRVEYLTCFEIISEKNWIDQITLNRPPNQPWTITRRSQEHLRSFHVWQTSRSPVYRTLICALLSSWLYMLCAQHPIEALNCMRQRYSFVFARVTSPLYCLLRSSDLKFESEIWSWVGTLTWAPRGLFTW